MIVIDDASKKIESNSLYEIKEDTAKDAAVAAAAQKVIVDRVDKEYGVESSPRARWSSTARRPPTATATVETNNGDLITDAMLWKVMQNKDGLTVNEDHVVAITNGGGIRAAITRSAMSPRRTSRPFSRSATRSQSIYVTGDCSCSRRSKPPRSACLTAVGGFPQVSGISLHHFHTGKAVYDANADDLSRFHLLWPQDHQPRGHQQHQRQGVQGE